MRDRIAQVLALAALTSIVVSRPAAAAAPSEMVHNGGFEEGGAAAIGTGWRNESYGSVSVQFDVSGDRPQLGKYCQHVHAAEYKDGAAQLCQVGIPTRKGQRYSVVLWLRGNLSAPVSIGLRKHGAPYTYYMQQSVQVTPAWQRFTITGTPSETDDNAGLYIIFSGNGDLWIDSVSAKPDTSSAGEITTSQ